MYIQSQFSVFPNIVIFLTFILVDNAIQRRNSKLLSWLLTSKMLIEDKYLFSMKNKRSLSRFGSVTSTRYDSHQFAVHFESNFQFHFFVAITRAQEEKVVSSVQLPQWALKIGKYKKQSRSTDRDFWAPMWTSQKLYA